MKTYKDLKEWVGESSTENLEESWVGFGIPNLDSPAIARNPGDSVDTADFSVENSNVIEKLNTFLQSLCQRQYINPYYLINDIWKKLSLVGLNFNMRDVTFPSVEGRSIVPISSYGGRYGVLGDPTSYVSSDDGTRIPGGLNLIIMFQKNGGAYTLDAHLERGIDTAPFVEAASPVSEAADYLADTRKDEYPFGSGDSIHRLGIHHGRATFHPSTKQWHHTDRPKWFHGTPQLKTGNREDLHRKIIDQGERLYGLKKSVTESIEVRYASPKDALGNPKPGWYIIDNGQYSREIWKQRSSRTQCKCTEKNSSHIDERR